MNFTIVDFVLLLSISSITTAVFAQVFKTILTSILGGKFDIKTLFSDGDFPSSHTAILISFNTVFWNIIYSYSISNPNADMFAPVLVGLVLALWSCYEIRNAMGVRLRVQEHAYAIKQIALTSKDISDKIEKLKLIENDTNSRELREKIDEIINNIKLKIGHLPSAILGGIVIGELIGLLFTFGANGKLQLFILVALIFAIYIILTILFFIRKRKKSKQ